MPSRRKYSPIVPDTHASASRKLRDFSAAGKRRRFGFETTSISEMLSTRDACDPLLNVPIMVCSCQPRIKCNFQRVLVPDHPDTWGNGRLSVIWGRPFVNG